MTDKERIELLEYKVENLEETLLETVKQVKKIADVMLTQSKTLADFMTFGK